jgi:hypothetical protein
MICMVMFESGVSDNYSNIYYNEVMEGVVNPQCPEVPSSGRKRSQR